MVVIGLGSPYLSDDSVGPRVVRELAGRELPGVRLVEAHAGGLIIGHFSARYKDVSGLVEEARTIFPQTIAAEDGRTYDVGNLKL